MHTRAPLPRRSRPHRLRSTALAVLAGCLALAACGTTPARSTSTGTTEKPVASGPTAHARGNFTVQMTSEPGGAEQLAGTVFGQVVLVKRFDGDLVGNSIGRMLSAQVQSGAATYVAVERVAGTLDGRTGSFMLVHRGTMTRAGSDLSIIVLPDSGTGDFVGITGSMSITQQGNEHAYDLAYSLPRVR